MHALSCLSLLTPAVTFPSHPSHPSPPSPPSLPSHSSLSLFSYLLGRPEETAFWRRTPGTCRLPCRLWRISDWPHWFGTLLPCCSPTTTALLHREIRGEERRGEERREEERRGGEGRRGKKRIVSTHHIDFRRHSCIAYQSTFQTQNLGYTQS